jgi:hypothetical protein
MATPSPLYHASHAFIASLSPLSPGTNTSHHPIPHIHPILGSSLTPPPKIRIHINGLISSLSTTIDEKNMKAVFLLYFYMVVKGKGEME